jgi:putative tryptophan/tyrosine transport system substrate-binding protein
MKRRESIRALVALVLGIGASHALSQPRTRDRPARIAILDDAPEAVRARLWGLFRRRLHEIGYTEGKDLLIEARSAGGNVERLSELAKELVALKPEVIVTVTTTVALVAQKATSLVPIVALGPADPVKSGLVASLARPGGNLTGISPSQAEIAGKWIEMVRELVPQAKSVAYLTDRGNPGEMLVFGEVQQRARPLGMQVQALDGVGASGVEQAFTVIKRDHVDAIIVATTTSLLAHRQQIVEGAARLRVPAIYARQEYLEAGGLLSYGADLAGVFLRAADYVHRILLGAKPAELPFEMASTFRLAVNLTTARTLGMKIPQSVLARADQVIE